MFVFLLRTQPARVCGDRSLCRLRRARWVSLTVRVAGYIDLSKRRVSPEDIVRCEEKYNKSKSVHSIMRHVSETCRVPLADLYTQFGWDLYKRFGEQASPPHRTRTLTSVLRPCV